ncbi:uncharacterized protein [Mycetomoellerius zeteki]|uniref:uncharacterized protein n=1 Tax=Mycetomoellerius zeteki TaxID=64791 RepID=UPI00084E6E5C|nr:PREDICTED: uncharacterized protein LOC108730487 [Trachymyrmex zeteki]
MFESCTEIQAHQCFQNYDENIHVLSIDKTGRATIRMKDTNENMQSDVPSSESNECTRSADTKDKMLIDAVERRPALWNFKLPAQKHIPIIVCISMTNLSLAPWRCLILCHESDHSQRLVPSMTSQMVVTLPLRLLRSWSNKKEIKLEDEIWTRNTISENPMENREDMILAPLREKLNVLTVT